MKRKLSIRLNSLSLAAVLSAAQAQDLQPEVINFPDAIYMNATIITLDDHEMNDNPGTIAEAMAVRDEKILKLGTNREILRLAGPETRVVDLHGKTVLPGIVESHVHPFGPSIQIAREKFNLRRTPEGYALSLDVESTADETMAKVAKAMDLLLANAEPRPDEWINIDLVHVPELGFPQQADVSLLMSAPRPEDAMITQADLTEISPNHPLVLTSQTSILSAPEKNVWYYVTAGPEGEPVRKPVVEFKE